VRIIVDIGHPAHVHFFKNFIWKMRAQGHKVLITAGDKDVALSLLKAYGFEYTFTSKRYRGLGFAIELAKRDFQMFRLAREFKPDVITGLHSTIAAHISRITSARSVIFTDTEHPKLANAVTFPFADVICTPMCFKKDLGRKQVRYEGYHELAYLHSNYFTPDPEALNEFGLSPEEKFTVVRLVSWGASHDVGQHGVVDGGSLVAELEKYGRVLITSERKLPTDLERYRITVAPEKLHDLLYYATLYVGEGATVASECAVLGTPAIYVNTLSTGYLKEEEEKYGLIYCFSDPQTGQAQAMEKAVELLQRRHLAEEWRGRRDRLLADKIDVTQFMVDFIENYPESFREYRMANSNRQ
jgi:predicted glycosyltransferase